jgi:hypothetical protein
MNGPILADDHCPLCRAALWAPSGPAVGTKACPRCGAELWVLAGADGPSFHVRQPGQSPRSFLAALAASVYGESATDVERRLQGADSLDLVELVLEIEAHFKSRRP